MIIIGSICIAFLLMIIKSLGHPYSKTHNFDDMERNGLWLNRIYASSVCSPASQVRIQTDQEILSEVMSCVQKKHISGI